MHLLRCGAINRIAFDRVCALRPTLFLVKRFTVSLSLSFLLFYLVPCTFAFWASSGDLNGAEVDLDAYYACRNSNCWTFYKGPSNLVAFLFFLLHRFIFRCLFFAFHGWRMLAKATVIAREWEGERREIGMRERENGTCCSTLFSTLLIIRYEGIRRAFSFCSRTCTMHRNNAVQKSVLFHGNRWNSPLGSHLLSSADLNENVIYLYLSTCLSVYYSYKVASRPSK